VLTSIFRPSTEKGTGFEAVTRHRISSQAGAEPLHQRQTHKSHLELRDKITVSVSGMSASMFSTTCNDNLPTVPLPPSPSNRSATSERTAKRLEDLERQGQMASQQMNGMQDALNTLLRRSESRSHRSASPISPPKPADRATISPHYPRLPAITPTPARKQPVFSDLHTYRYGGRNDGYNYNVSDIRYWSDLTI